MSDRIAEYRAAIALVRFREPDINGNFLEEVSDEDDDSEREAIFRSPKYIAALAMLQLQQNARENGQNSPEHNSDEEQESEQSETDNEMDLEMESDMDSDEYSDEKYDAAVAMLQLRLGGREDGQKSPDAGGSQENSRPEE